MLDLNSKKTFTLFRSARLSAQENMSIDRALFERFQASDRPIFRVYSWEASFTYGMSQKIEKIQDFNVLRPYKENHAQRMTGGGILFHGNDISYALLIPTAYVENLSVKESYEVICTFLMTFYTSLGLDPMYAKDLETISLSKSEYCQQGFEPYDIVIHGKKVGGNAQRRSKASIFQHGSICIRKTIDSMGNSLEELGVKIGFKEAEDLLIKSFKDTFAIEFEEKNEEIRYAS